jgi:GLPGLI family protein
MFKRTAVSIIIIQNMKKLLVLVALIPFGMNSQTIKVTYEERANIENQLKNVKDPETRKRVSAHLSTPTEYSLINENKQSMYFKKEKSTKETNLDLEEPKEKFIEVGNVNGGLYKNQKDKTYYNQCNILGKEFLIKDVMPSYDWEFTKEVKNIGDFECKKATAIINGKGVEAWFATKIPISDGPAEYCGLPGLIIELKTEKKSYLAIKLEQVKSAYTFVKPNKGKVVTQKQYNLILEEQLNALKSGNGTMLMQ